MSSPAKTTPYALVAYLHDRAGKFVEELRGRLYPERGHIVAHITVLPPCELLGDEQSAIKQLQEQARRFTAFDAELAEVESFAPSTPTAFIRVARGAHRFRDMHHAFNSGALRCKAPWPYMPHLTVVKALDFAAAEQALTIARERWAEFAGPRLVRINELTFVRERDDSSWLDLATVRLKDG